MDFKDIKKIVELMETYELSEFSLEQADGDNLQLKRGGQPVVSAIPAALPVAAPAAIAATAPAAEAAPAACGKTIDSPMVGTFYIKPAPDADNFVSVGDSISEGQVICIIEAMKVMNEIKAETSGTITAIVAEDGKPVQFGDALFSIS